MYLLDSEGLKISLSDRLHNLLGCLYTFPYHHQLCISYPHLCFGPPITLRLPPLSFAGFCFLLFPSSVRSSTSSCLYPGSVLTKVALSSHLPNLVKCTHCSRVGSCLRDCMIASHPWSSGSIPPPRSSHTDSETKHVSSIFNIIRTSTFSSSSLQVKVVQLCINNDWLAWAVAEPYST